MRENPDQKNSEKEHFLRSVRIEVLTANNCITIVVINCFKIGYHSPLFLDLR